MRVRNGLALLAAASSLLPLGLALAELPGPRTSAMTSLEEALIVTPDMEPAESRLPVLGYLHRTEDGWRLDMLPGAVPRTGPFPVLTDAASSALENMTSHTVITGAPLFRVDY